MRIILYKFNFIFLLIFIIFYHPIASYENTYIKPESVEAIKNDMPSFMDLMVYLPVLNSIVDFCEQYKKILSINLVHGLFLLNVNLNDFVSDSDIPEAVRNDLRNLLTRTDILKTEFNNAKRGKMGRILATTASNVTSWSKRVKKLNFDLLPKTYSHGEYPLWKRYINTIEAIDRGVPQPSQSDECVGSLIQSEENQSEDLNWRCELPNECYKAIINGTDFGYWLTHRIILLLEARLSRNCAIFSVHEDQLYKIKFCEQAYREAEYIAYNGFETVDLFLEQIAVCALDSHAQFLRRSWLLHALEYQQPSGCFQTIKLKSNDVPDVGNCDDHTMGVALAAYAAAVRFILQNYKRVVT